MDAVVDPVTRCVAYLFGHLITEMVPIVYDIVAASYIGDDWHVILSTSARGSNLYEFTCKNNRITVSTYVKAHSFHAEF